MSIVERALEKSRASQQQASRARRADDVNPQNPQQLTANRVERAAQIDPAARILGLAVTVDAELCRDRRVLLQASADDDTGAIAAYRMLRTRLLHRARNQHWTTIAVTSAGPNDGKTLTSINLALSMAREKSREVVLLDLDMRNPSVCRTLGIYPPHELRTYLESGEHLRELFFSVGSDNLLIAGSISPSEQASELLASQRFDTLMSVIREGAVDPIIIIDLPPVLRTDDALVVAPKVDALLVVASEGLTDRSDLQKALQLVAEFPIAGVVINRSAESSLGYSYGYEYDSK